MPEFVRDPNDWLRRLSPDEWIAAAMNELRAAERAHATRNVRGAIAGCKRAAGMALNGALIVVPNEAWGRTYVEHVEALADDASAPEAVRAAARVVADARAPAGGGVVALRTPSAEEKLLEATKDVMAHAYAIVKRQA